MTKVYVIPTKNGRWRYAAMSDERHDRWSRAYLRWWDAKGHRLAISPEMWPSGDGVAMDCAERLSRDKVT